MKYSVYRGSDDRGSDDRTKNIKRFQISKDDAYVAFSNEVIKQGGELPEGIPSLAYQKGDDELERNGYPRFVFRIFVSGVDDWHVWTFSGQEGMDALKRFIEEEQGKKVPSGRTDLWGFEHEGSGYIKKDEISYIVDPE